MIISGSVRHACSYVLFTFLFGVYGNAGSVELIQTRSIDTGTTLTNVEEGSDIVISGRELVPFSQFDTTIGTLTGVDIHFSGVGTNRIIEESNEDLLTAAGTSILNVSSSTGGFTDINNFNLDTPSNNLLNEFLVDQSFNFSAAEASEFLGTNAIDVDIMFNALMSLGIDDCPGIFLNVCSPEVSTRYRGEIVMEYHFRQSPPPIPVPPAIWLFVSALAGLIGLNKRRKTT